MKIDQGDKENQITTLNKYAFACAIVASMVSIVSGYGNVLAFSITSHFNFIFKVLCILTRVKYVFF
jgi:hypothetical protein